jgi:hypothetical protein
MRSSSSMPWTAQLTGGADLWRTDGRVYCGLAVAFASPSRLEISVCSPARLQVEDDVLAADRPLRNTGVGRSK